MRALCAVLLGALCASPQTGPAGGAPPVTVARPGLRDLCPVCGMIVAKYPNWVATVAWKDGHAHHFDGARDLFRFLQALPKYAPNRKRSDIRLIAVTEFYDLKQISAEEAYYVIGSDVMGPMGHELVPFSTKADAEDFLKDHRARRILRFREVTPELLTRLEAGKF
ncbi:nitrous oxide reductase accessory protein NosL [Paludibaculum fermentans]|uniref:nitrous oxide reductase accessory protein NosL n=1 Tax=Paludibaculum fermentans TaxID=1473598 RepID=UPI003EBA03A3